jgi:deoxyadenosine/deoxycytidine kinase
MSLEIENTLPEALKGVVVAFEGNIAAGKSTAGLDLKKQYQQYVEYAEEDINSTFLNMFYKNPSKEGFAFQVRMLFVRREQLARAKMHNAYPNPKQLYFWDRSMLGDHMFALWNHFTGSISAEQMRSYEADAHGSLTCMREMQYLKEIKLFVLLNSEPEDCKRRAESVRGRKEESGIPLPYYQGIDDMHFYTFIQLIEQKLSKVLILNWGEYNSSKQVLSRMETALQQDAAQPRVERLPNTPPASALGRPGVQLYKSEQDVLSAYDALDHLEAAKTVYIPSNIMVVDPASKGIILSSEFNITFYHNAYKRVVLRHLSQNSRVVFYKV